MSLSHPHTTLEQWRVLQVVVDAGSYAKAAEILHRSQSSLSYSTAQLQQRLGVTLLRVEGRKAVLTTAGAALLAEAKLLIEGLWTVETMAATLAQGLEPRVRLSVESLFPKPLLFDALDHFRRSAAATYVELREMMRQDVEATLTRDECDLCIGTTIPSGYLGDPLIEIELVAVAAANHPLHQLERALSREDLAREVFIALEDASSKSSTTRPWLITNHRWTMSTVESAISAVERGMGFAWLPRERIEGALHSGALLPLALKTGRIRTVNLYLVQAHPRLAGPSTQRLSAALLEVCASSSRVN